MHVSVIIPTAARDAFLRDALHSVAMQSHQQWECIVVDDASSDDTECVVNSFSLSDNRFRYLRSGRRGHAGAARNVGIVEAKHQWVAFLDDDDIWLPHKLETQVAMVAADPEVGLVFGRIEYFGDSTGIWPRSEVNGYVTLRQLAAGNVVPCSTAMARLDLIRGLGGFAEGPDMLLVEDYDLWLRIVHEVPILGVSDVLTRYRVHPGGLSRREVERCVQLRALTIRMESQGWIDSQLANQNIKTAYLREARFSRNIFDRMRCWWNAFRI